MPFIPLRGTLACQGEPEPKAPILRASHPFLLHLLLCSLFTFPLTAQDSVPQGEVFFESVDVDIVNVDVFVTDARGNPVTGLTQKDFHLFVDGEERTITNFYAQEDGRPIDLEAPSDGEQPSEEEAAPIPSQQRLHMVVFVDNLHISSLNRQQTFKDLRVFLDKNLNPGDYVTIASQNRSLIIHNDFTNDRVALGKILDEVELMATHNTESKTTQSRLFDDIKVLVDGVWRSTLLAQIREYAQKEFATSVASIESLEALLGTLGGIKGRKAIVHVSDGIPSKPGNGLYVAYAERFGGYNYEKTIGAFDLLTYFRRLGRAANAAGVTFYALDAETDHTAVGRDIALAGGANGTISSSALSVLSNNAREPLELTAQTTGGRRVQRSTRLAADLEDLASDFTTFYSLGFPAQTQSEERSDEKKKGVRNLEIKVVGKKLRVRHRETFQRMSQDTQTGNFAIAALLYHAVDNPLGIALEAGERQTDAEGHEILTIQVKIPIGKLALLPQGPTHNAQVAFFVSVKDKVGATRQVTKTPFFLKIPAERVEEAIGREAVYPLKLEVHPGDRQVVVAMRDDYANMESAVRMDL